MNKTPPGDGRLPAPNLMPLIGAFTISRLVYSAAELGLADILADEPKEAAAIAAQTGISFDPRVEAESNLKIQTRRGSIAPFSGNWSMLSNQGLKPQAPFRSSSRGQSAMPAENADAPNVRIIPPFVYLVGLALGFLMTLWMPFRLFPYWVAWPMGGTLVGCGALLSASAVLRFKGVRTTVRPDRAASTLVTTGPYRITRNPMYLGLALVYLGVAIAGQSVWAIVLLPLVVVIIQRYAIEREEVFLNRRFGADYVDYTTRVRRWI